MILFNSVIFTQNNDAQIKRKVWLAKEYIVQLSEYQPSIDEPKCNNCRFRNGRSSRNNRDRRIKMDKLAINIFWFTVSGFIIGGWIAYKIAL
jgi:hypothetical protein